MAAMDDRRAEIRRKAPRRVSDDCSQCDIYAYQIGAACERTATLERKHDSEIEIIHRRIDKTLPWRVFLVVVGLYLCLAAYNAVAINKLAVNMARVETRVGSMEQTVTKIERSIGK